MFAQSRRALLSSSLGLATLTAARAAFGSSPDGDDEILPLWPGTPPGGEGVTLQQKTVDNPEGSGPRNRRLSGIAIPALFIKRAPQPNGAAVIAIPGGGYSVLNYDAAGTNQARWLNALGVTTIILVYRLPGEGWAQRADVPLQDAQRAIRIVRANADRLGIDPSRVAVLGSSAGGHVAGSLATRFEAKVYQPVDRHDLLSARPDLAGLLYPVVTMGVSAHIPSRHQLLGNHPPAKANDAYSLEKHVPANAPPTFICSAGDDKVVSPMNSLDLYQSLWRAGIKAELHMFQKGGHGFGSALAPSEPASSWPELFAKFARQNRIW